MAVVVDGIWWNRGVNKGSWSGSQVAGVVLAFAVGGVRAAAALGGRMKVRLADAARSNRCIVPGRSAEKLGGQLCFRRGEENGTWGQENSRDLGRRRWDGRAGTSWT